MEVKRLGDIATYINGYAFKPEDRGVEGLPIIRIQDLTGNAYDLGFYNGEYPSRIEINNGDVLISWSASLGAYIWNRGKALLNQHIFKVVFDKVPVDKQYFVYAVRHKLKEMESKTHGATMKHIVKKDFENTLVPFPSLEKQAEIANLTQQVAGIIEARQKELQYLDDLIKARFVEMFGDPETNPMKWGCIQLGEICDLQNGYAFKSDDYLDHSTVLNCRMSNIRPDGGFDADYHPKYLPDEYWDTYQSYRLVDGDVIIAMTDMASDPKILGVPTIVKSNGHKFLLNQRVGKLLFRDTSRMNNTYIMFFLGQAYIRKSLAKAAGGSTQINVGKPAILSITILEPPLQLQDDFAHFVSQVDKSKVAIQKALDEAQILFDSLMQQYFG